MNFALCYSGNWSDYVRIEVFAIQQLHPHAKVYLVSDTDGKMHIPGCEFIDVERLFQERIPSKINVDTRFTRFALYRLLLPEIIGESRLLYVDSDAIVNANLQAFWDNALWNGAWVAGARDIGILPMQLKACGLDVGDTYINAGVTLMDLDAIRAARLPEIWYRYINSRHFACHDQDVINMTCRGHINFVGNEYNSSASTGFAAEPKIMHWAGPATFKPWANKHTKRADIWKKWVERYQVHA